MESAAEREAIFRKDLQEFLDRNKAEIDLLIEGYNGQRSSISITLYTKLNDKFEETHEFCEFDL